MSPDLHPPFPLQLFFPLQSCLLIFEEKGALSDLLPAPPAKAIVLPARRPAIACELINDLNVAFIAFTFCLSLFTLKEP